jgi:hypothetical protein
VGVVGVDRGGGGDAYRLRAMIFTAKLRQHPGGQSWRPAKRSYVTVEADDEAAARAKVVAEYPEWIVESIKRGLPEPTDPT